MLPYEVRSLVDVIGEYLGGELEVVDLALVDVPDDFVSVLEVDSGIGYSDAHGWNSDSRDCDQDLEREEGAVEASPTFDMVLVGLPAGETGEKAEDMASVSTLQKMSRPGENYEDLEPQGKTPVLLAKLRFRC